MIIVVGSLNAGKIQAVQDIIKEYDFLKGSEVVGVDVSSDVSHHPVTLKETVRCAVNRAKNAFRTSCNLSIGIESGLMPVPYTLTGYMDFCACAIFDGKRVYLGLSSFFEYPENITRLIVDEDVEASDAAKRVGLTTHEKIGTDGGIISIISGGRLTRQEYTKQALVNALLHVPMK